MSGQTEVLWNLRQRGSDRVLGSLTTEQVRTAIYQGRLQGEDGALRTGQSDWQQLAVIDEFEAVVAGTEQRRRVPPAPEDEGIDMTPMIDVTFLLLIFFMITASFHLQKGLDFPPGETEDASESVAAVGPAALANRIVLEIGIGDEFFMKDIANDSRSSQIPPEELIQRLREESLQKREDQLMIVPHELASNEAVVLAIDSAAQAGILKVSVADIVTESLGVPATPPKIRHDQGAE